MKKRHIIQIFLLSSIFFLIFFIYFPITEKKIKKEILTKNKTVISTEENTQNIIQKANFVTKGDNGVLFEISSDSAKTLTNDPNINYMENVNATITFLNGEKIFIKSDKANFNQYSSNSNFEGNIKIDYNENTILCENLDVNISENLISLYNNIEFNDLEKIVYADQMNINLINKQTKVFMFDENKKVKTVIKN
jgi:lipopolysaccharide export system protein LptA|tara:strand:- start:12488 stop:13069 length:582 start_codon:yes stop_codon:yes gene_type:complete